MNLLQLTNDAVEVCWTQRVLEDLRQPIITRLEVLLDHQHQTLSNVTACMFKVRSPVLPHCQFKTLLDHVLVGKLAGVVPHGSGELAPRLALIASLFSPSVVCVGGAPGPTAFPAAAVEAVVGGRLVTLCALSLHTSGHRGALCKAQ